MSQPGVWLHRMPCPARSKPLAVAGTAAWQTAFCCRGLMLSKPMHSHMQCHPLLHAPTCTWTCLQAAQRRSPTENILQPLQWHGSTVSAEPDTNSRICSSGGGSRQAAGRQQAAGLEGWVPPVLQCPELALSVYCQHLQMVRQCRQPASEQQLAGCFSASIGSTHSVDPGLRQHALAAPQRSLSFVQQRLHLHQMGSGGGGASGANGL